MSEREYRLACLELAAEFVDDAYDVVFFADMFYNYVVDGLAEEPE